VPVEIRPVATKRELDAFIKLPWTLYATEEMWVPPLISDLRRHLDRDRNPFFEHAEAEYFLAYRDSRLVGRISAHIDRNLNEFQGNEWGLFGFFECEDDQEAADALLGTAKAWLTERERERMVGPVNFTTNDECGLLVDGFEYAPSILTPWTHRYYPALLERAGFTKAMDVQMWELWNLDGGRESVLPVLWELADQVESKHGIVCRYMRKRDLQAEIERFLEVYNAAWERNWGFVPLSDDEVRQYAKDLKPILDEHWAMVAERKDTGEVVGAALTLPDYNQVLKHLNGRLLPFGWIKALYWRRKIDRVRVFALGVKKEYQHTGVAAKLYQLHYDSTEITPQKGGEMGWILETNRAMNRGMEAMGGKVRRRYRFYEALLPPVGAPAGPADAGAQDDPSASPVQS
jgi:GNAT superfamily N-acetyltransferase